MRALFIIGQLDRGGAEYQTTLLATAMVGLGDSVGVICLSERTDPYAPRLVEAGVELTVLPRSGGWEAGRVAGVARAIRGFGPDAICAIGEFAATYSYFARWATIRRPRLVAMLRRSELEVPAIKRRVFRWVFSRADAVCANSEAGRRYAARFLGVPERDVILLRNALPAELLTLRVDREATRRSLGTSPDEGVVLYVGRYAPAKDIPTLCRTLARLGAAAGGARRRAWVVGAGLSSPPPDQVDPGPHVSWLGERTDVPALMASADVLLLTSRSEGTPNVVLEAMARRLPVVSTAVGDVPELVDRARAGRLAPVGDDVGLAAQILELLAEPEIRVRLGAAGRAYVAAEFDPDRFVFRARSVLRGDPTAPSA